MLAQCHPQYSPPRLVATPPARPQFHGNLTAAHVTTFIRHHTSAPVADIDAAVPFLVEVQQVRAPPAAPTSALLYPLGLCGYSGCVKILCGCVWVDWSCEDCFVCGWSGLVKIVLFAPLLSRDCLRSFLALFSAYFSVHPFQPTKQTDFFPRVSRQ